MSSKFFAISSKIKIVLNNEVIIYYFNNEIVKTFFKLIDEYFDIWKNIDFVNFFEKHWMKISFKSNWENKISNKAKIYFLNKKNWKLIVWNPQGPFERTLRNQDARLLSNQWIDISMTA